MTQITVAPFHGVGNMRGTRATLVTALRANRGTESTRQIAARLEQVDAADGMTWASTLHSKLKQQLNDLQLFASTHWKIEETLRA